MSWTAVVLAGSRPGPDPLAEQFKTGLKALIPLAGEPMVRRPVSALLKSDDVGKIIVVSQSPGQIAEALPIEPRIEVRQSKGTIAETIEQLILEGSTGFPLIVTTADHALLDREMIEEFMARARGADVAIGVVDRQSLLARLPQTKRTWLTFRGGAYSGANLFALGSIKALAALEQWRSVEQDRKKGWRVLLAIGPALLMGAILRLRTLDQSVARVGNRLGLSARAIVLTNPLAGVDVDKSIDHSIVEAILSGRA